MALRRRRRQIIDHDVIEGGFINDPTGKKTAAFRKKHGIKAPPAKKTTPKKKAPKRSK